MQGGEEARSETYLDVRCNDEQPHPPFERGLRSRKLRGGGSEGGHAPLRGKPSPQMGLFQQPARQGREKPRAGLRPWVEVWLRRSVFLLARARSSAFRARIAAIRSASGVSNRSLDLGL